MAGGKPADRGEIDKFFNAECGTQNQKTNS